MKDKVDAMLRQHEELRALASDYERELDKPKPDLTALSKCRWTLARLISAHLAYEGAHLYPQLTRLGGRAGEVGGQMATEIVQLTTGLQAHVREWTADAITTDWAGYRAASKALIELLRSRMAIEENHLYPLALVAKAA